MKLYQCQVSNSGSVLELKETFGNIYSEWSGSSKDSDITGMHGRKEKAELKLIEDGFLVEKDKIPT